MIKFSTTVKSLFSVLILAASATVSAQTIATFEDVTLDQSGVYNGMDQAGSFTSAGVTFRSAYDTQFSYWSAGFAASNKMDSVTAGYSGLYATRAGVGANGSAKFAVGQQGAIVLTDGKSLQSVQITNNTYAARSMETGDQFAKKFGGQDGTDPDYFKLIISAYVNGEEKANRVEFYLADFRSANSLEDYIRTGWETVDLTSLGTADSIEFILESSDVGQFGINTPTFFCIDNLTLSNGGGIAATNTKKISSYPNPVVDQLFVNQELAGKTAVIRNITGAVIVEKNVSANGSINLNELTSGVYTITIADDKTVFTGKVVKQ